MGVKKPLRKGNRMEIDNLSRARNRLRARRVEDLQNMALSEPRASQLRSLVVALRC